MVSEEVRAMIPDYVRGLLSPADAKEVEGALESSPEIYPEFEAAQTYYAALNQIPEVKAPTNFIDRVNRRIDHVPFWPRVSELLFEPLALKLPFELAGIAACLIAAMFLFNPFSSRGRLPSEKPVAAAVRKAVASEETRTSPAAAALPAEPAAAVPAAGEPAAAISPEPFPEPPEPEEKAETPAPAAVEKPATEIARAAPPVPQPVAAAKKIAVKEEAAPMAEKKAAAKPAMMSAAPAVSVSAPAPAAAAPRGSMIGRLDAIPTLPSVATAAPAPRAPEAPAMEANEGETALSVPARAIEAPKAKTSSRAEDIGTIDLAPEDGSLSSASPETAENILSSTAVSCTRTMQDGKTAFLCKLPPDRLDLLIVSLARSFAVTTHLFPYDAAAVRMVSVTFVIQ